MARSLLEDVPEQTFTSETIKRMYRLVQQAVTDPAFQKIVYGIVNGKMRGQWKDYRGELQAVLTWYKQNVDYRRDPFGVELLQDVWATLDRGRGDCDDATVWLCAAAQILGCPTRIITVSTRPDKEPVHVYPEAMVKGRWAGLDATVPGSFVGWKPLHVTDTKVWTRQELGLSGDEDLSNVEGLGMNDNGYGDDGFGTNMRPVSDRLAPGVPDDISHTYGAPIPGTSNVTGRKIWRAPVANNADRTSDPRPGGGVYNPALPVKSMPTPREIWDLVDRKFVPKVLDPDSAWWGKVPTSKQDLNRMFPGSEGTMANYLKDIASVPASAIAEIEDDVRQQLAVGEIGLGDLGDAIQEGLEDYALGKLPRMKRAVGQRGPRRHVNQGKHKGWVNKPGPRLLPERRYLVPAPANRLVKISGGGLNGLGDIFDDAAKALSTGVQSGTVPPSSVNTLINDAVAAITGQPAPAAPKPATAATAAKFGIPVAMIAALGLAAFLMSKSGGKAKYRRNPSRRRSSRSRGRRGGGIDMKTALLWGGGGLAAYFLLLRPGAPLMPKALTTTAPKPAIPGMSPTDAAMLAAGVKAAPSIFDSIAKLFGGGSTTTATKSTTSTPGIVTSYDQLVAPAPAPAPSGGMVTSYDQLETAPAPAAPSSSEIVTEYYG